MSAEKYQRVKTELPHGDLLVAMHLVGMGGIEFTEMQGAVLNDLIPRRLQSTSYDRNKWAINDGQIYISFRTPRIEADPILEEETGDIALRRSAALLWHGLGRYAALAGGELPCDVEARCDSVNLIDPSRPLSESYGYIPTEVTPQVRDDLANRYRMMSRPALSASHDFMTELEHLASH